MDSEVSEEILKSAGASILADGRRGIRINGWEIVSNNGSILNSSSRSEWEEKLATSHLPEMVFGDSFLTLRHFDSGTKLHFNAFDALIGWKKEALPPVEVPAAEKWKFRSKPSQEVILDYDYTFTTPYSGSETIEDKQSEISEANSSLQWEEAEGHIDFSKLSKKESILFFDEVVLYEDELADNGVSLLTVKVRVMPTYWFLLLRFWLRVDGVLMRLRDTRIQCIFNKGSSDVILRETSWREATFKAFAAKGYPTDAASYSDPNWVCEKLPLIMQKSEVLKMGGY